MRALESEENEEARRKRRECEGGKRFVPLPLFIYAEEIVGARFTAHDLVNDGELWPHDRGHDSRCGLTAARSATRWATRK